jgi:REP element-mobilizing transposase RayT
MPWGLKHFQQSGQLHFLTFSCYRRRPNFATPHSRGYFEWSLERVRQSYGLRVYGYVVMPNHVHLLVNEPERGLQVAHRPTLYGKPINQIWDAPCSVRKGGRWQRRKTVIFPALALALDPQAPFVLTHNTCAHILC